MKLPKLKYVSRIALILDRARGKRVLHLGCVGDNPGRGLTQGDHLHLRISSIAGELWGIDTDEEGLRLLSDRIPSEQKRLLKANAERLDELSFEEPFDLVLAGDLIEHLEHPAAMFRKVHRVLAPKAELIVTTPNAFGLLTSLRLLRGIEAVNPQHVCFFSFSSLRELSRRCGFDVVEWCTAYDRPPRGPLGRIKLAIGAPFFKFFPFWGGTLVAVMKPSEGTSA